jgi:hypothetical protein
MQVNYSYSSSRIDALLETISKDRLQRYIDDAGGDEARGLKRYVLNTKISEAFYTPIQGLEIALRNSLHNQAKAHLGENWFAASAATLRHPATEMIGKAERALTADGKIPTPGRMLAELNFGFWVTLLSSKYENSLWRPCLRKAFPNRPKGTERKQVHGALNAVRRLRNRIAHHEPILQRQLDVDY